MASDESLGEDPIYQAELEANRRAYELLRNQLQRDHAGKYIVLAFGRVIGVTDTYGEGVRLIQRLQPQPRAFEVFLAEQQPLFDTIEALLTEFQ